MGKRQTRAHGIGAAAERVQDGQSWNSHSIDVQVKRVAVGAWAGHFARPKWGTVPVCRKTCAVVALCNLPLHTRSRQETVQAAVEDEKIPVSSKKCALCG